ncbi:MAG: alkane 1-monooxygenase [Paracoccaceae bacterium]
MRPVPVALFALVAVSPLALLALGIAYGGLWPVFALAYMAGATVALDLLLPLTAAPTDDTEFPAADGLLVVLGLSALTALPLLTWAVAGSSNLGPLARTTLFLAGGLWFGQVAHPAAHELIHRPRPLFSLGIAVYTALLFGHHASAHRLVHHPFVASADDPNTARANEPFYRFLTRAWAQSFRKGWRAETALRTRAAQTGLHPYVLYIGGAVLALTLAAIIAGPTGLLTWTALGLFASVQILLSDYVQHYGLTRTLQRNGKPSPVTAAHSWNSPHWFSSALMLNAPRHSDHHTHPLRPYPALRLPDYAPILPWPLPIACAVALIPPLWRRRMQPELARRAALSKA